MDISVQMRCDQERMKTVKKKHKWTNILYLAKSNGDFRDEMLTRVEIASTKLIRKISKSVH